MATSDAADALRHATARGRRANRTLPQEEVLQPAVRDQTRDRGTTDRPLRQHIKANTRYKDYVTSVTSGNSAKHSKGPSVGALLATVTALTCVTPLNAAMSFSDNAASDVLVFPEIGVAAARCGDATIEHQRILFPMVLQLGPVNAESRLHAPVQQANSI